MTKTIRKRETDPATSADDSITDPNATVILASEQGCEAACPSSQQPTEDCEETIRALTANGKRLGARWETGSTSGWRPNRK